MSGPCPSEEVIAAFVADDLDDGEREALERHMDACPSCQAVVTEMVRVFAGSHIATVSPDESITPDIESSRDPEQVPVGTSIGRYRVVDVVGIGGMGIVYAAEDPELERRVAVKVLRTRDGSDDSQRLLREARAMAKLSHPNVIAVHDVGTWNDRVFVAMELVDGGTLRGWLESHPRDWTSVWPVLRAAGQGLAAAHEAGFVHRDLKPDNVLVSARGRVFVTDFGLARWAETSTTVSSPAIDPSLLSQQSVTARDRFTVLTRSGAFVGTPAYMAPEQFLRGEVGAAADQFAYCVVTWEALFGERPFRGATVAALAHAVCESDPPAFPAGAKVPRGVKAALLRGLAKEPNDRFSSMSALLRALEPRRRAWVPWAGAGVIAATSVAVAVVSSGGANPEAPASCDGLSGLDAEWNDDRRDALRSAFARTQSRYASSTSDRVIAKLDAYAQAWSAREVEVCEAGLSTVLDPPRAALRQNCLDRSRELFAGIVGGLEEADAGLVDRAVRVVTGLPEVGSCVDDAQLTAELPPVPPPELASEVSAVRAELLAADADLELGHHASGLARVDDVVAPASKLGFAPLVAEVAYTRGRLLGNLGRAEEATVELERAALEATASRHLGIAARAQIVQLHAMGRRGDPWPSIAAEVKRAEAAAEAARLSDSERASLYINAAIAAYYAGEPEIAEAHSMRALALIDREHDPMRWATASLNLAAYQRRRGAVETSLPVIRSVIEVYEEQLGRVHPDVAEAYRELAIGLKNLERYDEARVAAKASLEITAEAVGETHYSYGGTLSTLSGIEGEAGNHAEALALAERSSKILAAAGEPTQIPDSQRAEWLIALGRPDEASPIVDRLLADEVAKRGEDSPTTAWIWFVKCWLESTRKNVALTRKACDRGIELTGAEPGSDEELAMQLDRAVHLTDAGGGREALAPLLALVPRVEEAKASPTTARIFRELAERTWPYEDRREQSRAWMERAHGQFVELELTASASDAKTWLESHVP